MHETKKEKFYGWRMVFAGFVLMATVLTILANLPSLFVVSLEESLGVGRSQVALQITISSLVFTFCCPFVGRIIEKTSLKLVMSIGVILCSGVLFAMAFVKNLFLLYIVGIVMGFGLSLCTMIPVNMMIQNWFKDKRGVVTGIVFAGTGFGGFVFTQVITKMMIQYGYEAAYLLLGLVVLVICLPITMFLVKLKPEEVGQTPYGNSTMKQLDDNITMNGIEWQSAKKTSIFWIFFAGIFFLAMMNTAVSQQAPANISDLGYDVIFISWINSLLMISMTVAKPIMGYICDKKGAFFGISLAIPMILLAVICLLLPSSKWLFVIFGLFYGLGASIITVTPAYMTGIIFGKKDYATIYGIVTLAVTFGAAFGSPISGLIYDQTGSYSIAWIMALVGFLFSWASLWIVSRRAKKVGNIRPKTTILKVKHFKEG